MTNLSFLLIAFLLTMGGLCNAQCVPPDAAIADVRQLPGLPGSGEVVSFAFMDGVPIVVVDGIAWSQDPKTCQWTFALKMYDPSFFDDSFFMKNGRWFRRFETGESFMLSTEFADDFEFGSTVNDLILPDASRYTSFVLLSPMAPTVPEYNALRNCILAGTCDFLDNRIDFDPNGGRNNSQSLKFYSVAPTPEMITAKCLVERGMLYFAKGDSLWFSGWYKAQGSAPFTIVDFESSGIIYRPGFRVTIRNGLLSGELKWLDKPQYLQKPGSEIPFPLDQWVHVRVHIQFSEDEFGRVKIWQDDTKVVDQRGRTLPTADSVIDFVQIGITATPVESVLHVDDVQVSRIPISPRPPRRRTP
jgi:polysaccharide lyase-like protein